MCGSSESASDESRVCNVVGEVNVNADDGGCGAVCWDGCGCERAREERMAAWSGSRREASISVRGGVEVGIEGAGGGGRALEDEAIASQAAFSSSCRLHPP